MYTCLYFMSILCAFVKMNWHNKITFNILSILYQSVSCRKHFTLDCIFWIKSWLYGLNDSCDNMYVPMNFKCTVQCIDLWQISVLESHEIIYILIACYLLDYTVKVYHWGSYQDSGSLRPDLFPEAKLTSEMVYFTCIIIPKQTFKF